MNKKNFKSIIITSVIILILIVAVVVGVSIINKPKVVPTFETDSSGSVLLLYNGSDTDVVIPKQIKTIGKNAFEKNSTIETLKFESGSQINTISRQAFNNCVSLTSVTFPRTLKTIGYAAFKDCSKLDNVIIPDSVETIDEYAFSGCISLENLTINSGLKTINNEAFANTPLVSFKIPNTLTSIGKDVFKDCDELETLNVDESNEVFTYTDGMLIKTSTSFDKEIVELVLVTKTYGETLTIPSNITKINSYAFVSASSLKELVIPMSVTEIENNALIGCTGLTKITIPFIGNKISDNLTFPSILGTKNFSSLKEVVVLSGNRVVEKAFKDCSTITKITLPTGVEMVGAEAFSGCTSLSEIVNFPTTLKRINKNTFNGCSKLTDSVFTSIITSNTEVIEDGAFSGCTSLTNVVIPENIKHIGLGAFESCSSITSISVPFIGMGYKLNIKTNELTNEFDNTQAFGYIFGAASIEDNSKSVSSVRTVIINGNYDIPENAFYGCSRISSITLSNNVKRINASAFNSCTNLKSIVLPEELTSIGEFAFLGCNLLNQVTIGSKLEQIEDYAFSGCKNLTKINLNLVNKLGSGVFQGCAKLKEITVNEENIVFEVENKLNDKNEIVSSILYTKGKTELVLFASASDLQEYIVPSTVVLIHSNAFDACKKLKTLIIGTSVQTISSQAITNCTELTNLTLPFIGTNVTSDLSFDEIIGGNRPSSLSLVILSGEKIISDAFINVGYLNSISLPSTLKEIASSAFLNCTNLIDVDFTKATGLEVIGDYAFMGCSLLSKIELPNTVKTIGTYAFADASNVKTINIPDSLEYLGDVAFKNMSKLTSISIKSDHQLLTLKDGLLINKDKELVLYPSYITNDTLVMDQEIEGIKPYAFSGAVNLKEVTINENITELNEGLFYNCTNLTKVTISSNTSVLPTHIFDGCTKLTTVNVNNVLEIKSFAFKNCYALSELTFNEDLNLIEESAFENCTTLATVKIPGKVKTIGKAAFKGCSNLKTLTFLEGVERIEASAFEQCTALTDFTFPTTLSYIGNSAFRQSGTKADSFIENIYIHENIKEIGSYAFSQCMRVKVVYISEKVEKIGTEAFSYLSLAEIFTSAVKVEISKENTKIYTYPTNWDKGFWMNSGVLYGEGQFELVNGVPTKK